MEYRKKIYWLIAISTLVRVIAASTQELGNVEAYYWALSTKLQWNYFDHPPMMAWLIRLTTANLLLHHELFVRLGAIVSAAVCTWVIFKIGNLLYNPQAGWFAALLYSTCIYSGVGIAVFILPDSPQMVFWLSALYVLLKITRMPLGGRAIGLQWCLFGLLGGLCIMCKVHGVFLWVGAAGYIVFYDRKQLSNPYLYLSLFITLVIISPIFIWNLQNHFITYKFHSSRVTITGEQLNLRRFIKQVVEIVFSTGPIHCYLLGYGIYLAIKGKLPIDKKITTVILACSLPLLTILLVVSLFREVLPHWPGPALSMLLILPAIRQATRAGKKMPLVMKLCVAYALVIVVAQCLSINYFPGTLSTKKEGMASGTDDATLDMYGWKTAGIKFDSLYRSDVARHIMPQNAPIVITNWVPAAHIDFYIAHKTGQQTFGIGNVYDLHQYLWMNHDKRPLLKGQSAYFLIASNYFTYEEFNKVTGYFKSYSFALIFPETRSGIICKQYYILRLTGYKGAF